MNPLIRPPLCSAWLGFALIAAGLFGTPVHAHAAEASLSLALSPEVAYQVRAWRRAHGLPQAPETATDASKQAVVTDQLATRKALQLAGLDGAQPQDVQITARHDGSHWQVSITVLQGDLRGTVHEVDVADAVAARLAPHAP